MIDFSSPKLLSRGGRRNKVRGIPLFAYLSSPQSAISVKPLGGVGVPGKYSRQPGDGSRETFSIFVKPGLGQSVSAPLSFDKCVQPIASAGTLKPTSAGTLKPPLSLFLNASEVHFHRIMSSFNESDKKTAPNFKFEQG